MKTLRISEFVNETFAELLAATPEGYVLADEVEFELSLVETSTDGGRINLKIIKMDDKIESHMVQKIVCKYENPLKKLDEMKLQVKMMGATMQTMFSRMSRGFAQMQAAVGAEVSPEENDVVTDENQSGDNGQDE